MLRKLIQNNIPISPEVEEGNVEYKLRLNSKDKTSLRKMATQMVWRLNEGKDLTGRCEAIYFLGVKDDGEIGNITKDIINESIDVIKNIVTSCHAEVVNIDVIDISDNICVAELVIRKFADVIIPNEYRCILLGPSGHGKTTFLSKMAYSQKDNGNGMGRSLILKYLHEQKTGVTSSIRHEIIGCSDKGELVNYKSNKMNQWESIVKNSNKIISIFDTPGCNKYIKTKLYGLLAVRPHFAIIIVSIVDFKDDILNVVIQNIQLCCSMDIPYFVVFTKANKNNLGDVKDILEKINQKQKLNKYIVTSNTHIDDIDNITKFINEFIIGGFGKTSDDKKTNENKQETEFIINDTYNIPDRAQIIVSGIVFNGSVDVNGSYLIGPINNEFHPITINNIHNKEVPCKTLSINEGGALELSGSIGYKNINKNLVIVSKSMLNNVCSTHLMIELLNNSVNKENFLWIGYEYNMFFGNNIEPFIVEKIDSNKLFVRFKKDSVKYVRNNAYCIIQATYKKDMLTVGIIRNVDIAK